MTVVKMTGEQYKLFNDEKCWNGEQCVDDETIEIDGTFYCDEDDWMPNIPAEHFISDAVIIRITGGTVKYTDPKRDSEPYTSVVRKWLKTHIAAQTKQRLVIEIDKDGLPELKKLAASLAGRKIHFKIL